MSENRIPENDGNENQNQNEGKKDYVLEYHLIPGVDCIIFNIVRQHPNVERFLNAQQGGLWRDKETGVAVTLGWNHPEIVTSGKYGHGVQIRLDGTGGAAINKGHVDITRFASTANNIYRDGMLKTLNRALESFGKAVKAHFAAKEYVVYKQDKSTKITV